MNFSESRLRGRMATAVKTPDLIIKGMIALLLCCSLNVHAAVKERWLQKSKFGLMFHYEAFKNHNPDSYNRTIDSFEVGQFVSSVKSTKADYIIFVIGQHW